MFVALIKTYYFQLYLLSNHKLYVAHDSLSASVISSRFAKKRKKECQAKPKTALIQLFVKMFELRWKTALIYHSMFVKNK